MPMQENHMRTNIYDILRRKLQFDCPTATASHERFMNLTSLIDSKLMDLSKSQEDYLDLRYLEYRIDSILQQLKRSRSTTRDGFSDSSSHLHTQFTSSSGSVPVQSLNHSNLQQLGSQSFLSNVTQQLLHLQQGQQILPHLQTPFHHHRPIFAFHKETLPQQAIRPSMLHHQPNDYIGVQCAPFHTSQLNSSQFKLQHQHNVVQDHYITAQCASVHSNQLISSPYKFQNQQNDVVQNHYIGAQCASVHTSQLNSSQFKLQDQHNVVQDHYIGAQCASVHTSQLDSSQSKLQHQQKAVEDHLIGSQRASVHTSNQLISSPYKFQYQQKDHYVDAQCASIHTSQVPSFPQHPHQEQSASETNNGKREHTPMQPEANDRERDFMKQRMCLLFMIHARHCTAAEDTCESKFCFPAKKLLRHMQHCKIPDCKHRRCPETRKLILHYKECRNNSCPVCEYVRNFKKKKQKERILLHRMEPSASLKCIPKESSESMQVYDNNDDVEPSAKRLKMEQLESEPLCKPHHDDCKREAIPKVIDSEKDGESADICLSEENEKEISSLIELFTPEQIKEHIRGLRQWSKTKAMTSMDACQLCGVENLVFQPIPIYCSPCGVRIKRRAFYYCCESRQHHVCTSCYNEARENFVSVDGTCIPKAKLDKKKNIDEQVEEGWVQCDKCQAWQHQICALFNSRRNHGEATKYTCPNCYIKEVEQGERRPLPQSAIPGATSLPVTTLSNHIEQRLFNNLKKERQERATLEGKSYEEVPGAESLAVRVVSSVDKVLQVKEHFFELFRQDNYPSEFPYKSKAILLFQKIENVEVCLFAMFVQEFGTESGPPNQRRVYLSYLDSVKYFRPEVRTVSGEALRTFVYHEILIGYLDYCKKRGYTSCYIWTCPPLKGEDYILYCHPEIQETPKNDKLREWYLAMLRKASKEDVVVECTNLYDQFFVQSGECRAHVTAERLPYFDGDYWPGAAEDLLHKMRQKDDATKSKATPKRALSKDLLLMQKLGDIICPLKKDFIMVHLQHCCTHCCTLMVSGNRWVCNHCKNFQICDKCNQVEQKRTKKERHPINQKEKHHLVSVAIKDIPIETTEEKDDNIESEFFDNRQAFLNLCQGNNYQYDTLRRAKHSSMMILYHLHNPTATICTICQRKIENAQGWHCEVCTSYDVCNACHPKASIDHSHNLISRSSAKETTEEQNEQANANQIQLDKIKQVLVHVAACRLTQCQYQGCHRMKVLFKHCTTCKIGPGGCHNCKKLWGFIRLHARSCRDSQCTVPKCRDVREISSRQQKQSDKRQRAAVMEMMRERAAEATQTC